MKTKNIGSSFDSWLREEGIYEEVSANAIKRVLARQVKAKKKSTVVRLRRHGERAPTEHHDSPPRNA